MFQVLRLLGKCAFYCVKHESGTECIVQRRVKCLSLRKMSSKVVLIAAVPMKLAMSCVGWLT